MSGITMFDGRNCVGGDNWRGRDRGGGGGGVRTSCTLYA